MSHYEEIYVVDNTCLLEVFCYVDTLHNGKDVGMFGATVKTFTFIIDFTSTSIYTVHWWSFLAAHSDQLLIHISSVGSKILQRSRSQELPGNGLQNNDSMHM